MSQTEYKATTTLAFIAGIGAGMAAGILFAPRAGEETRQQLKDKAQEARTKAKRKMDEERATLKDRADEVKAKARKVAEEGRHVAKDVAKDIKARADERSQVSTEPL
jgi:gas vesicle protein